MTHSKSKSHRQILLLDELYDTQYSFRSVSRLIARKSIEHLDPVVGLAVALDSVAGYFEITGGTDGSRECSRLTERLNWYISCDDRALHTWIDTHRTLKGLSSRLQVSLMPASIISAR
jgi:hypothetical protein